MQLLIIRHAYAGDREKFAITGLDDNLRPLTAEGCRHMQRAARALRGLVPELGILATSPLLRATQTAEIVADEYGGQAWETWPELAPGIHAREMLARLQLLRADGRPVAVVGHEPDLSDLASWMLFGRTGSFAELEKGTACLLEVDGTPDSQRAVLKWITAPDEANGLILTKTG